MNAWEVVPSVISGSRKEGYHILIRAGTRWFICVDMGVRLPIAFPAEEALSLSGVLESELARLARVHRPVSGKVLTYTGGSYVSFEVYRDSSRVLAFVLIRSRSSLEPVLYGNKKGALAVLGDVLDDLAGGVDWVEVAIPK